MKIRKPALVLNPAAPMLCSSANILVAATAPPYTTDWIKAAIEFAATPATVNPIPASPSRKRARAITPPNTGTNRYKMQSLKDHPLPSPFVLLPAKETLLHTVLRPNYLKELFSM